MDRWHSINDTIAKFQAPKSFSLRNGFTRICSYNKEKQLSKILASGTFSSWGFGNGYEEIPHLDHAIIYKNYKEKKNCLVYIPYADSDAIIDEVNEWCENNGLKASVYEDSWYMNSTCTVIITLPNIDVIINEEDFKNKYEYTIKNTN